MTIVRKLTMVKGRAIKTSQEQKVEEIAHLEKNHFLGGQEARKKKGGGP